MTIKVVYSRTTDKYVGLSERARLANSAGADAFVSIHCNAATATARGFETFSFPGSSGGRRLATSVHDAVTRNGSLVNSNRGLKTANFAVLRLTNMPAALVELGFITNALDARLLKSKQDEFAKQIAEGIRSRVGNSATVFLDAGHGGRDPGATGHGIKEKDIALSVTLKVGKHLQGKAPNSKPSTNVWYGVNSKHNTKAKVQKLQRDLEKLGHSVGSYGTNGVFGKDTKAAVIEFQKKHGLQVDGQAGTETLSKIKQLLNKSNKPDISGELYRVRQSWENAKTQKGAYKSLDNAIDLAKKHSGYKVYNSKGAVVYPKKTEPTKSNLYRVRKSWANAKTQKGAFKNLDNAIERAKKHKGYKVYDAKGAIVYPKKTDKPTKPNPQPKPDKPKDDDKVAIEGSPVATARQMAKLLISKNSKPKIKIKPLELCKLFIEEGKAEGIRGDIAFCQSMKETGWLKYGGQSLPEQNNYAGIGATNNSPVGKGAWFDTERIGVRAQIQHLKAYANKEPLKNENVDPRFHLVTRGVAPNWTDLNGRWAVPGNGYGESILEMYEMLLKVVVDETDVGKDGSDTIDKLQSEIDKLKRELKKSKNIISDIKDIVNK